MTAPPIRIVTPWDQRDAALRAVRGMVDPPSPSSCVRLERVGERKSEKWPLVLSAMEGAHDGPPRWAIASWGEAEVWGAERATPTPIGFEYQHAPDGSGSAALVDFWGGSRTWTASGEERPGKPVPGPRPVGRDCVALLDGEWWVVDPVAGTLYVPDAEPRKLEMSAIGLTRLGDRLVVGTADQQLHVLDRTGRIERSFPASVVPPRRLNFGECAILVAGNGWIASYDWLRGLLWFYDVDGTSLGRVPLAKILADSPGAVRSVRGAGDYLGVGHGGAVSTLRVVREPRCADPARGASPERDQ